MIIVSIMGGLGNQLFQYTFAKYIEQQTKIKPIFSVDMLNAYSNRLLDIKSLGLPFKQASRKQMRETLGTFACNTLLRRILFRDSLRNLRKKTFITDEDIFETDIAALARKYKNLYFHGYWQEVRFYESVQNCIWSKYSFPNFTSKVTRDWAKRISETSSVSIHVRRGDYLKSLTAKRRYGLLSDSYYVNASNYISSKIKRPEFFIFSDDPDYVEQKFPGLISGRLNIVRQDTLDSWTDMHLMSYCQHNILSNSTYGWWGATLNKNKNKIVIAPRPWYLDRTNSKGLIPISWKTIKR